MNSAILGIDIAKGAFEAALIGSGKSKHKSFANTPSGFAALDSWLAAQGIASVHACLEATGRYGEALAYHLHQAGHTVSVVNPAQIKGFAKSELLRTKTDKVDASLIARFCQAIRPEPWIPPAPAMRQLQALVRRMDALARMRQQEANRLETSQEFPMVKDSIKEHLSFLEREIKNTRKLIKKHIERNPDLKAQSDLLRSIPGIGETTASLLLAEIVCVERYSTPRQLVAHAGLAPGQHVSGSSVHRKTRLCKVGNSRFRKGLYFPSIVAQRYNPLVKTFCNRLLAAGKTKMQVICAAMRKLLHLAFGVLKSKKPFDPSYATFSS